MRLAKGERLSSCPELPEEERQKNSVSKTSRSSCSCCCCSLEKTPVMFPRPGVPGAQQKDSWLGTGLSTALPRAPPAGLGLAGLGWRGPDTTSTVLGAQGLPAAEWQSAPSAPEGFSPSTGRCSCASRVPSHHSPLRDLSGCHTDFPHVICTWQAGTRPMEMTHKLEGARSQHPALLLTCCWSRFLTRVTRDGQALSVHQRCICCLHPWPGVGVSPQTITTSARQW